MRKRTLIEHLHELRYHMIAGLFWYLISLVTWTGIASTFAFLRSHLGTATTVVIDVAAAIVVFGVVVYLLALWAATTVVKHPPNKFRKVQVYRENSDTATYKRKVRIAITNETGQAVDIRKSVWIANGGEVGLELPPKMKMQIEKIKGGYLTNQWVVMNFMNSMFLPILLSEHG